MRKKRRLTDAYHFPPFTPEQRVSGLFGDSRARVIRFTRRQKKQSVEVAVQHTGPSTTASPAWSATFPAATHASTSNWRSGVFCAEGKVSLGFVEGLNNKIRVIQRRSYGLRDEDDLRLKVLTCMLPDF